MRKSVQKILLQSLQVLFCPIGPFGKNYSRFEQSFESLQQLNALAEVRIKQRITGCGSLEYDLLFKETEANFVFGQFVLSFLQDLSFIKISIKNRRQYFASLLVKDAKPRVASDHTVVVYKERPYGGIIYDKVDSIKTDLNCLKVFWLIHVFDGEYQLTTDPPLNGIYQRGKQIALQQGLIRS